MILISSQLRGGHHRIWLYLIIFTVKLTFKLNHIEIYVILAMPESEENSILGESIYHAVNFQVIYVQEC